MALNLKEIRERLATQKLQSRQEDNVYYPFWNMQDGAVAEIRFLPDENPNNPFFWVERLTIRLPFEGTINGQTNSNNRVEVVVPCMEMYGKKCPIQEEIRPMWKDKSLEEVARVYYKKRSYIFQGFIVKDGLGEENPPENPIRKILINPSLFKIIRDTLLDPDIEDLVIDFDNGRDFRIKKTRRGTYSDYSTSQFALKNRPLSREEREAIETYGLHDLSTLLPPEPTEKQIQAIIEMFQASLEGEPYDYEKWGQYYKPYGRITSVNSQSDQEEDTTRKLYSSAKMLLTTTKQTTDLKSKLNVIEDEENKNDNEEDVPTVLKASEKPTTSKHSSLKKVKEETEYENVVVESEEDENEEEKNVKTVLQKSHKKGAQQQLEKNTKKSSSVEENDQDDENTEKVKNILEMIRKLRNN